MSTPQHRITPKRQRQLILALLVAITVAAWGVTIAASLAMDDDHAGGSDSMAAAGSTMVAAAAPEAEMSEDMGAETTAEGMDAMGAAGETPAAGDMDAMGADTETPAPGGMDDPSPAPMEDATASPANPPAEDSMAAMGESMDEMNMRLGVEVDSTSGALWAFVPVWTAMMAAMMFPSAQPMFVMFGRVQADRRERGGFFVSTWIFVAGYLLVWVAAGLVALLLNIGLERLADDRAWVEDAARWGGGVLLLAAAAYQLTPLKAYCLNHCRSPLHFILHRWRDGNQGALLMGLDHGVYCLGCCWGLMAVLFVIGVMSLPWMLVLAVLIYAEKATPLGRWATWLSALVLGALGVLMFVDPGKIPS
jgi:predicted metal-binding membrane protein